MMVALIICLRLMDINHHSAISRGVKDHAPCNCSNVGGMFTFSFCHAVVGRGVLIKLFNYSLFNDYFMIEVISVLEADVSIFISVTLKDLNVTVV